MKKPVEVYTLIEIPEEFRESVRFFIEDTHLLALGLININWEGDYPAIQYLQRASWVILDECNYFRDRFDHLDILDIPSVFQNGVIRLQEEKEILKTYISSVSEDSDLYTMIIGVIDQIEKLSGYEFLKLDK